MVQNQDTEDCCFPYKLLGFVFLFLRCIPYFVRRFWGIRLFCAGLGSFLCLPSVVGLQDFFVASAVLCPDCFIDWLMVTVEILDQGGSDYIGELSAVFR